MNPDRLRTAFLRANAPKPVVGVSLHHVTPVRFTVAETVEYLAAELPHEGRISFRGGDLAPYTGTYNPAGPSMDLSAPGGTDLHCAQ